MDVFNLEHNIVNLLYSIKGLIESHLDQAGEGRFKESHARLLHAEEAMKQAFRQADQALKVTKKIMEAHQNGNKNQDGAVSISIKKIWGDVETLLKQSISFNHVEIIDRVSEDFPEISCHPDHLKEILYNLAKNALQAMENLSAVRQSKRRLILRAQLSFSQKEEPFALITFSDTGPGIPEEHLAQIFEPFFTTKSNDQGNGLGLHLVKTLVLNNQGRISVSSFKGEGTTFSLQFPLAQGKHSCEKIVKKAS